LLQKPHSLRYTQYATPGSVLTYTYSSGALIHECNGVSQFIEDTGKPSVPVLAFNLMPASLIEPKNSLPDLEMNSGRRELSARQASRHCGL